MDHLNQKYLLFYWVPYTDIKSERAFPLSRKNFLLDSDRVQQENSSLWEQVWQIHFSQRNAPDFNESSTETFTIGVGRPSNERNSNLLFKHLKPYLVEISQEEVGRIVAKLSVTDQIAFAGINYDCAMNQDGDIKTISELREDHEAHKGNKIVIANDPRSVIRSGPSNLRYDPATPEFLKQIGSIYHFFDVVELLSRSDWIKTDVKWGAKCYAPNFWQTTSVLLLFRQFLDSGRDQLITQVATAYATLASHPFKEDWVRQLDIRAKGWLTSPINFPLINSERITPKMVFDAFIYGAGLAHPPNSGESRYEDILNEFGHDRAVFVLHWCAHQLYGFAVELYLVCRDDVSHWIQRELIPSRPADSLWKKLQPQCGLGDITRQ